MEPGWPRGFMDAPRGLGRGRGGPPPGGPPPGGPPPGGPPPGGPRPMLGGPKPPEGPPPPGPGIAPPRPPPKPPEGPPPPGVQAKPGLPSAAPGRGFPSVGEKRPLDGSGPMLEGSMGMGPMGSMGMGMGLGMGMGMAAGLPPMGMMGRGMMGPRPDLMPGSMMGSGMLPPGDIMGMGMGFGMGMPAPGALGMGFGFDGPGIGGRGRGGLGGFGGGRFGGRGGVMATGPSRGEANDYCQHFVDTGQRPQNFLRDSHLTDRYEEYPKLKELVMRKDEMVSVRATPPYYLKADLKQLPLSAETFGTKFDVVLIDPPWEEYVRRAPGISGLDTWAWQEIMALEVERITDPPSFVFLWCGSAEGLDAGRHCLKKWGFRRCEDICWIKTNKDPARKASTVRQDANSMLQHTKEHCLMGIKGTVRRSTDGHIIHANVDTDIIVSEEPPLGSMQKPEEMYHIIEHFAMGRRRLELFGEDHNVRPGWLTVGNSLSASNFNPETYASHFRNPDGSAFTGSYTRPPPGAPHLLGSTEEIENLRPRTPPPGGQ